jgi:hypothetical protein
VSLLASVGIYLFLGGVVSVLLYRHLVSVPVSRESLIPSDPANLRPAP